MPDIVLKNFIHIILFYPDNFLILERGELEFKRFTELGHKHSAFLLQDSHPITVSTELNERWLG